MSRDKTAKFIELANKRVNKAIKDLQLIGNLSNRQNYEYHDEQAKKIIKALQHEVDLIKQSFLSAGEDGQIGFKL
jgi:ABC-type Fe3+-hydroxamate transport system substrate-binding protein